MRTFSILLSYLLLCLVLAAALNYPLYRILTSFGEIGADRLLYRSAMLIAALGLWPLLRRLQLADRAGLGLAPPWPQLRGDWTRGVFYGLLILGPLAGTLILIGVRPLQPFDAGLGLALARTAAIAALAGILIGLIEEIFFRGILFAALRRRQPWLVAALLTASFYAFLHFVRPEAPPAGLSIDWGSGLNMLAGALHKYATPQLYLDSFVALFMAGLLLALVRESTGSIALGMGMHAGWVFAIRLTKEATEADWQSPYSGLIGHYDGVIGWLAAAWIAVITLGVYWWPPRRMPARDDT
jgi:membrane protease YdiL (CAAX protease family)